MNPYLVSWLRFNDENDIAKDECGNSWSITGSSPTITTDNAILGTAGRFTPITRLTCTAPLITGGRDFSFDFYVSVCSEATSSELLYTCAWVVFPSGKVTVVYSPARQSMKLQVVSANYFAKESAPLGTRHHYAFSYVHETGNCYLWLDGTSSVRQTFYFDSPATEVVLGFFYTSASGSRYNIIDEFRLFDGIALWTGPFTPPTTEADYDLTELSFSVFMPATRSIVKPIDELANVKRTVNKTADEFSNLASRVVSSENIFSNVKRTVDKSAEEFANVKREVTVSAVNDISPTRRTLNVSDNFANVNRTVNFSTENFSATKRGVVFSEEYDFQPQRRLTNFADEFAPVRRLVHEPQVVDIYTRRRLLNLDDNFADVRRKILSTSDNVIDLSRAVIFTDDNFSPTKRTVNKTATESADTKRQILFSADNDCDNVRRVINADDNFANVTSSVIKTTENFAPTLREALRSEIYSAETSRRVELRSVIVTLKSQQGEILGRIRFLKDKTSSIGHLVTLISGIKFYAGLVDVDSPSASSFRVMKYGTLYAVEQNL